MKNYLDQINRDAFNLFVGGSLFVRNSILFRAQYQNTSRLIFSQLSSNICNRHLKLDLQLYGLSWHRSSHNYAYFKTSCWFQWVDNKRISLMFNISCFHALTKQTITKNSDKKSGWKWILKSLVEFWVVKHFAFFCIITLGSLGTTNKHAQP